MCHQRETLKLAQPHHQIFVIINTQNTKLNSRNSHKNSFCTISRNGMCPRTAVNSHQINIHGVMTSLMKPSSSTPLAISVNMGIYYSGDAM